MSETIPPKIILPQPKKKLPSKDKKADKQDNVTQKLFDYVLKQAKVLITSTLEISETSKTSGLPELIVNEPEISKPFESVKPISKVINMPPKETDSFKSINKVSTFIFLSRA